MKENLSQPLARVTLRHLRAVTAVIQSGSMSGAARLLGITTPAVNQQINALEDIVGMPLFDRSGSGMQATSAGLGMLDTAERIDSVLAEFGQTLQSLRGMEVGRFNFGVVSTAKYFAPKALAAFAALHPKVEMRLQVGNRGDMIAALEHHRLDFVVMGQPPPELDAEKVEIADHPHIIIAPPGHPMASARQIPLQDVARDSFLLREKSSGTRILVEQLFHGAGLDPNLGTEMGSNETIKQAVMAGLGIALISAHTVHTEIHDGRLTQLDVAGLPINRKWFAVKMRTKRLLPAAQAFWEFIIHSSRDFLPGSGA